MRKLFTLIELIIVIVILSVLVAIVVPNISDWQKESEKAAVSSNARNLQTSVDLYGLKNNGLYPAIEQPTVYTPQLIDLEKITPLYNRTYPKTKNYKYWIDYQGKVWASSVNYPKNVVLKGAELSWDVVPEADKYHIYEVRSSSTSAAIHESAYSLKFKTVSPTNKMNVTEGKNYLVSAVDTEGFETPPAGTGIIESVEAGPFTPTKVSSEYSLDSLTSYYFDVEVNDNGDLYIFWLEEVVGSGVGGLYYKVKKEDGTLLKDTTLLESSISRLRNNGRVKSLDAALDENGNIYAMFVSGYDKYIQKYNSEGVKVGSKIMTNDGDVAHDVGLALTYHNGYVYTYGIGNNNTRSVLAKYDSSLNSIYKTVISPSNFMTTVEANILVHNDRIYLSASLDPANAIHHYDRYLAIYNEQDGTLITSINRDTDTYGKVGNIVFDSNGQLWNIEDKGLHPSTINAYLVDKTTLSHSTYLEVFAGEREFDYTNDVVLLPNGNIMYIYGNNGLKYKLLTK